MSKITVYTVIATLVALAAALIAWMFFHQSRQTEEEYSIGEC